MTPLDFASWSWLAPAAGKGGRVVLGTELLCPSLPSVPRPAPADPCHSKRACIFCAPFPHRGGRWVSSAKAAAQILQSSRAAQASAASPSPSAPAAGRVTRSLPAPGTPSLPASPGLARLGAVRPSARRRRSRVAIAAPVTPASNRLESGIPARGRRGTCACWNVVVPLAGVAGQHWPTIRQTILSSLSDTEPGNEQAWLAPFSLTNEDRATKCMGSANCWAT